VAATDLLSVKAIEKALREAAESGKAKAVNDGAGLTLECQPSGAGWWRLRWWVDGKANRQSLGTYPDVSLAMARKFRNDKRQQLAGGVDPSTARKTEKADRKARKAVERAEAKGEPLPGTFEAVAREWLSIVHRAKVSVGHADRTETRFIQDVFPWIGSRPIVAIEAPELLAVLRRITERGAIETAHRAKDACGQVFRYGIACGHCQRNPAADLRDALPPVQPRHHAAIVDPKDAGKLLRDVTGYDGHPVTRAALSLSALLLLRPGELRQMAWAWVDLDNAVLTLPGEVMKRKRADKENGPPHVVPLARQAVEILRELRPLTGETPFVFPSTTSAQTRCMSENTVRSALRRMGYGNDDMTAHGFRAMARTMAAERLGIAAEVIEAQLAHAVAGPLGRAYDRTTFMEQRRDLMTAWADYLDRLREGAQVVPLNAARAA
jgi:integrase